MTANGNGIKLTDPLLVHPELADDPINMQNQVGYLSAAMLDSDSFFILFDDDELGLYSSDALLILKNSGEIYDLLRENAQSLSVDDFRNLKKIAGLLDHGSLQDTRLALQLVQQNPGLITQATRGLDEHLGHKQDKGLKR